MSLSLFHQSKSRYYIKKDTRRIKKIIRFFGLGLSLTGASFSIYFFFPLISWQLYLQPAFASQAITAPIPKTTIVTNEYIQSLWRNTADSIETLYGDKNKTWMPSSSALKEVQIASGTSYYYLSIPKIHVENAVVSTVDTDVSLHMINFPGTAVPPAKGTAAVFGHSTLPSLFDPNNYKTILAMAHTLVVGDKILVTVNNMQYSYIIDNISIVDAEDTSYLAQETDSSYLTIITCTPPGTIWKRLIIRSKLEKI
jgi:sortase A